MNKRFRLKLFFTMIIFAIVILFSVAFIDYVRLKEEAVKNYDFQITKTEEEVKYALQTIDKAYYLFDQETVSLLEEQTKELMAYYEKQPQFDEWDFQLLSDEYDVDIYIIDEHNVVTHSNKVDEIGLDFSECCKTLEKILNERRESGGFFVDAMDVEQSSGEIRRYSYMATDDKKYIIELGYSLQDGTIFEQFNFLSTIDDLIERFPMIKEINVLNLGGLSLGSLDEELPKERRDAFQQTRESKETTEVKSESAPITYRYVHYATPFDPGIAQSKILEIIYDESSFQALLTKHQRTFVVQFMIVLIVTIIISLLISRWMARPIYLAFHDSMTHLKNRAAFEEILKDICAKTTGTGALLMLDIDNFKSVNDQLGHDQGDQLLVKIARALQKTLGPDIDTFRVGGDEFAVVMHNTSKEEAKKIARDLRKSLLQMFQMEETLKDLDLGVSMGISLTQQHGENPEILYKAADLALYRSKYSTESKINICTEEVV
ncbi:MAG TPA: GGDEF domain-containing protein [Bacillota bacterium]|nr:GGDEF domain-containing protein [Bacillota bacterium]